MSVHSAPLHWWDLKERYLRWVWKQNHGGMLCNHYDSLPIREGAILRCGRCLTPVTQTEPGWTVDVTGLQ